jgi:hypothetical protein
MYTFPLSLRSDIFKSANPKCKTFIIYILPYSLMPLPYIFPIPAERRAHDKDKYQIN